MCTGTKQDIWDDFFRSVEKRKYYDSPLNPDVGEIVHLLPEGAAVLDLGCGMAKTALRLCEMGFGVTAVDSSNVAIRALTEECERRGLKLDIRHLDVCDFEFRDTYDLIIAHGIFQFLPREIWEKLIDQIKEHTRKGGINLVLVFSDSIPVPDDMKDMAGDMFKEGELFEMYDDWKIISQESYVKEDEHPGGIRHRHPMNKLVAVKR